MTSTDSLVDLEEELHALDLCDAFEQRLIDHLCALIIVNMRLRYFNILASA